MNKNYSIRKFKKEFKGYTGQYNVALDTNLIFSEESTGILDGNIQNKISSEVYFNFMGRKIRWINKTKKYYAVLVIPFEGIKPESIDECVEIANRFLSIAVKEYGQSIVKMFDCAGGNISIEPLIKQPFDIGGLIIYPQDLSLEHFNEYDNKKWTALSLYKEGVNSKSVYYSFLCFYKIIELAFDRDETKIIKWINDTVENDEYYRDWKTKTLVFNQRPYSRLYGTCRCAIAHAMDKNGNILNPDNLEDYKKINNDNETIRSLANKIFRKII